MKSEKNLTEALGEITGKRFTELKPLAGGFNCDVFLGVDEEDQRYFIKKYKESREDPEHRLATEFTALSFLWNNGIRNIPEPYYASRKNLIGIYEFIQGSPIHPGAVSSADVRTALRFWTGMHALRILPDARSLPDAKEACYRMTDYLDNVEKRLNGLRSLPAGTYSGEMHHFLNRTTGPLFTKIRELIPDDILNGHNLTKPYRTLSSSDFGFHNAIRKKDGTIIFHDFEYFGWDDPAKLIADFFLHPRMQFPEAYREDFYTKVYTRVNDPTLPRRMPFVYLLLAVKWALIMLNIFREPATLTGKNQAMAQTQLKKAVRHLAVLSKELAENAYPISLIPKA